jgi:flavin reductase (DIM6/NTAB) family NADH-FMN oxidoreductase RutF
MDGALEQGPTMQSQTPGPGRPRALRDAFGRFATGVTVITTATPEGPMAITANSFSSLSLDPPLLLWSPGKFSKRFAIFAGAAHFAVHVLGAEQGDLGARFARDGRDFDGVGALPGPGGAPLLPDCLARFACRTAAVHDGGDHAIVVGEVLDFAMREGAPLVFSQGAYGRFVPGD